MQQAFGENFRDNLLQHYGAEQLASSKQFLSEYLEKNTLQGLTFLDAGSGSGAFTLAAAELGANVTSFDYDPVGVKNTEMLLQKFGQGPNNVQLKQGSVLDAAFMQSLGLFDVVLCWGVAHHCGDMWSCMDMVSKNVKPGGLIHLGIYNHADGWGFYPDGRFGPSTFWRGIKKVYVACPVFIQQAIYYTAIAGILLIYLLSFNNPIKKLKSNERRGMNWQSDLKDWLIGYPYEFARPAEVFDFMKQRGFTLTKMQTNNGLLTNNFVFRKNG